jgi:pimeloyl-ACP methyl ester carboxylesterase
MDKRSETRKGRGIPGNGSTRHDAAAAPAGRAPEAAEEIANPPSPAVAPREPHTPWLREAQGRHVRSRDGVEIYYEVLGAQSPGAPALVLANGLGGRLYSWEPLVERLAPRWKIVTWDYRGLFKSSGVRRRKDLAIENHAHDVLTILDAEKIRRAAVAGWSMGVQVALEVAAEAPERVEKLVLLNGTHGHALATGFQPLFRLPWLSKYMHGAIDRICANDLALDVVTRLATSSWNVRGFAGLYARLRRNPKIVDAYRQYISDVFGPTFRTFLRLFQELDAHSAYHLLPEITTPALVVWGSLDPLTPAYQSREIARRLPNARRLHFPLGTHFVLLEYPEKVVRGVEEFLEG